MRTTENPSEPIESRLPESDPRPVNAMLVIPVGIALNLAVGAVIHILKLPIFLDAIGTIVVTLLVGMRAGIITGVISFLLAGVFVSPAYPWFSGTQAAIAVFTYLVARIGGYRTIPKRVGFGILLGVVTGILSAPVIVYLFGGISGSGASLIAAYLMATGKKVVESVLLSGLAAEPLDKTLQTLIAITVLKGLPKDLLARFNRMILQKNGLL
jgi:energy-coupling factor transport system substrate-specific component